MMMVALRGFPNDRGLRSLWRPRGGHEDFGIEAKGKISVPVAGFWTFRTRSDDGSILTINGVQVINDDTNHGARNRYGAIELTEGEHDFEYTFYERGGGASCELGVALLPGDHTDGTNNSTTGGGVPYILLENPTFAPADSQRDFVAASIQGSLGWEYGYEVPGGSFPTLPS